jgi:hypothetical protein
MTLKTTLLASVALCGLMAAPALARSTAPSIHLAGHSGVPMAAHVKSSRINPSVTHVTQTLTFTGSLSYAADFKMKVVLLGETWYSSTQCVQPTKEKWVGLPKTTLYARVTQSTSTGTIAGCTGTTFTFHDIDYELIHKKGTSDTVSGALEANHFEGYDLKLNAHIDLTLTKN